MSAYEYFGNDGLLSSRFERFMKKGGFMLFGGLSGFALCFGVEEVWNKIFITICSYKNGSRQINPNQPEKQSKGKAPLLSMSAQDQVEGNPSEMEQQKSTNLANKTGKMKIMSLFSSTLQNQKYQSTPDRRKFPVFIYVIFTCIGCLLVDEFRKNRNKLIKILK